MKYFNCTIIILLILILYLVIKLNNIHDNYSNNNQIINIQKLNEKLESIYNIENKITEAIENVNILSDQHNLDTETVQQEIHHFKRKKLLKYIQSDFDSKIQQGISKIEILYLYQSGLGMTEQNDEIKDSIEGEIDIWAQKFKLDVVIVNSTLNEFINQNQ